MWCYPKYYSGVVLPEDSQSYVSVLSEERQSIDNEIAWITSACLVCLLHIDACLTETLAILSYLETVKLLQMCLNVVVKSIVPPSLKIYTTYTSIGLFKAEFKHHIFFG